MHVYDVIEKLVVTEKSSIAQEGGKYTFIVSRDATKIDIKNAIKQMYGAEVATVHTMLMPKKTRFIGRGRMLTKRPYSKKAIVTLKKGTTIDPSKVNSKESKKK